jgi:hypothetical protein
MAAVLVNLHGMDLSNVGRPPYRQSVNLAIRSVCNLRCIRALTRSRCDCREIAQRDLLLQVRCAIYNGLLGSGFGHRFDRVQTAPLPKRHDPTTNGQSPCPAASASCGGPNADSQAAGLVSDPGTPGARFDVLSTALPRIPPNLVPVFAILRIRTEDFTDPGGCPR